MLSGILWLAAGVSAVDSAPIDDKVDYDVITVEASKRPLAANEIASSVTVIDAARIERELAQNIDDLVRYEPGVDVIEQGSRFGLSGFTIRGIGGNRVRIEVDGVATSDAFAIGSFSNASRDFVDVQSIRQVEIVRGPASALFGSNALGGVVGFVTKGPEDYLRGRDGHLDVNAGFNGVDDSFVTGVGGALRLGDVTAMLRANLRDGAERDTPGVDPLDDDSHNVLAKVGFGRASEGGLGLSFEHFRADSVTEVDSLERVQDFEADFGFPYIIDTSEVRGADRRERLRLSLGQEWLGGAFGTSYLRWRAYWQDSETRQDTFEARSSFIAGEADEVERNRSFHYEQALAGLEINAANEFRFAGSSHELAYGVEYERADTEQLRDGIETNLLTGAVSNRVGPDEFPLRDFPKSKTESMGAYLQARFSLGPFTLVPGLRWDRYELEPEPDDIFLADNPGIEPVELNDDKLSPKLGVLWDLGEAWQVYAQYAEGFRAPPVNDVNVGFTNFQFGYTALPNPDLESESSRGYEIGLRHTSGSSSWDIAVFSTRYDDFIESFQVVGFDPVNQLLLFQSVNVDEVDIEGVEFRGQFTPGWFPEGLSLNLSAAYADGENRETGRPINSVAPLNGVIGFDYTPLAERWGMSLMARGASRQDDLDETGGELLDPAGYVVYDAIGFFRPMPGLRVSAGVYNLTDRAYTAYLDVQGIPADVTNPERFQRPGRNVSLAFDWTF